MQPIMKSLPYFVWLLLVAVAIYWKLHIIALVVFGLWLFFFLYWKAAERWPRTVFTLTAFLSGLFGGGRRRW